MIRPPFADEAAGLEGEIMKRLAFSLIAACFSVTAGLSALVPAAQAAQPSALSVAPVTPVATQPTAGIATGLLQEVQYRDYRDGRWHRPPPPRWYRDDHRGWRHRHDYRPYYQYRRYDAPTYRRAPGNPHVRWCFNRYRSYRAYDNTFQPNYGPRQQCYSPYL